jgi:hypothetical protein
MLNPIATLAFHPVETPLVSNPLPERETLNSKLAGRWVKVDGKLVCQWYKAD